VVLLSAQYAAQAAALQQGSCHAWSQLAQYEKYPALLAQLLLLWALVCTPQQLCRGHKGWWLNWDGSRRPLSHGPVGLIKTAVLALCDDRRDSAGGHKHMELTL
jgi:hypothetical protein